jgi:hypothetical protein
LVGGRLKVKDFTMQNRKHTYGKRHFRGGEQLTWRQSRADTGRLARMTEQSRIPLPKLIGRKPASKAKAARYASVQVLPLASRAQIREIQALSMFGGSGAKFTRSSLASCR